MKKVFTFLKRFLIIYLIYILVFGLLIFKLPYYTKSNLAYDTNKMLSPSIDDSYAYLVEENNEAFNVRLALIENAKTSIDLIYYKYLEDEAGKIFTGALLKKANEGIKITIIIDGVRPLKNNMYKALAIDENICFKIYEPLSAVFVKRTHNVMHEKILLTDDNYGLIGGRNIESRFLLDNNETITLDRDVLVYSKNEKSEVGIEIKDYLNELHEAKHVKDYNPTIKKSYLLYQEELIDLYNTFYSSNDYNLEETLNENSVKVDRVSFIRSPLNRGTKEPVLFNVVKDLASNDQKVIIQSPYITKSRLMEKDFKQNSNKNITFITNNLETNPNMFGLSGYIRIRKKLAQNYNVYEYQKENSIHAKTITIGNNISIIGSQNIDHRSLYLSTESAVVIYSEDFQKVLNKELDNLITNSLLVNSDGTYQEKENLEAVKLSGFKNFRIRALSLISSLFNEMLFKTI